MKKLTRRELLQRLSVAWGAATLGCQKSDWFGKELVCIHIFGRQDPIPAPLLEKPSGAPGRRPPELFQVGLPELILCTTRTKFLDMFQYFWPFTRPELEQLQRAMTVEFQRATLSGAHDIAALQQRLNEQESLRKPGTTTAVILTFNDATRHWASRLVEIVREASIDELIILKDPSRPPYLCDYPSRQRGFKKPPP